MKPVILFMALLIFVSCVSKKSEENQPGNNNNNQETNGIGGTISCISDFLISPAHAADECLSVKSPTSVYYAELFVISDPSKLGTVDEMDGLIKLCDVDVKADNTYFFEADLAPETLFKIIVTDKRDDSLHDKKQIIAIPSKESFDIDLEKSLQARLIENSVVEDGLDLNTLRNQFNDFKKKYDEELLSLLIEKVQADPTLSIDPVTLFESVKVFETRIDDFWEKCADCRSFETAPADVILFTLDFPLSDGEKCFMAIDWDFDLSDPANQSNIQANQAAAAVCENSFLAEWNLIEKNRKGFLVYLLADANSELFSDILSSRNSSDAIQGKLDVAYNSFHEFNRELVGPLEAEARKSKILYETLWRLMIDVLEDQLKVTLNYELKSSLVKDLLRSDFYSQLEQNYSGLVTDMTQNYNETAAMAAINYIYPSSSITASSGIKISSDGPEIQIIFDNDVDQWKAHLLGLAFDHYNWKFP